MCPRFRVPIYARWDGRTSPVRWPEHRPEPGPGDVVRLDLHASIRWCSFHVVDRRDRLASDGGPSYRVAIDLDVEPLATP